MNPNQTAIELKILEAVVDAATSHSRDEAGRKSFYIAANEQATKLSETVSDGWTLPAISLDDMVLISSLCARLASCNLDGNLSDSLLFLIRTGIEDLYFNSIHALPLKERFETLHTIFSLECVSDLGGPQLEQLSTLVDRSVAMLSDDADNGEVYRACRAMTDVLLPLLDLNDSNSDWGIFIGLRGIIATKLARLFGDVPSQKSDESRHNQADLDNLQDDGLADEQPIGDNLDQNVRHGTESTDLKVAAIKEKTANTTLETEKAKLDMKTLKSKTANTASESQEVKLRTELLKETTARIGKETEQAKQEYWKLKNEIAKVALEKQKSMMTTAVKVDSETHERMVDARTYLALVAELRSAKTEQEGMKKLFDTLTVENGNLAAALNEANCKLLKQTTTEAEDKSAHPAVPRRSSPSPFFPYHGQVSYKPIPAYSPYANNRQSANGGPFINSEKMQQQAYKNFVHRQLDNKASTTGKAKGDERWSSVSVRSLLKNVPAHGRHANETQTAKEGLSITPQEQQPQAYHKHLHQFDSKAPTTGDAKGDERWSSASVQSESTHGNSQDDSWANGDPTPTSSPHAYTWEYNDSPLEW